MAVGKNEIQVKWSTANSVSVSAGGSQTSDAASLSATGVAVHIMVKADNAGTPASGDTITCWWLCTTGDPDADADSADEYSTGTQGTLLGVLDTNTDDPAIGGAWPLPLTQGGKLYVESGAGSNSITVSAQIEEVTVS